MRPEAVVAAHGATVNEMVVRSIPTYGSEMFNI